MTSDSVVVLKIATFLARKKALEAKSKQQRHAKAIEGAREGVFKHSKESP